MAAELDLRLQPDATRYTWGRFLEDVARLGQCGINAFLVGEAFMRREDPGSALSSLFFGEVN